MSQFGMQMPGARLRRGATPDVYTGLAVIATAFMIAAAAVMYGAATKVGKGGSPFELQEPGKIELKSSK
jgi:hypothetical protein